MSSHQLWVDKYRPSKIAECILPESVKKEAVSMVESKNLNHLILSGPAGTGKTTLAMAICKEMDADFIVYNGSNGEINLEELRSNISDFAHTSSLGGKKQHKIILIDEADGLHHQSQGALRHAMEKYSSSCRFILTCNFPDKLIEPIHSRCATIDYKFDKAEQNVLVRQFAKRTTEILLSEGVTYDIESLKGVIVKYFPDNRKILNELQKYANQNGTIDDGILSTIKTNTESLIKSVLEQNFTEVKEWVVNNSVSGIFNVLYKDGEKFIPKKLLPLWILKLAEYQKWEHSVSSKELNVLGCLTDFMSEME